MYFNRYLEKNLNFSKFYIQGCGTFFHSYYSMLLAIWFCFCFQNIIYDFINRNNFTEKYIPRRFEIAFDVKKKIDRLVSSKLNIMCGVRRTQKIFQIRTIIICLMLKLLFWSEKYNTFHVIFNYVVGNLYTIFLRQWRENSVF